MQTSKADPRYLNEPITAQKLDAYLIEYSEKLIQALRTVTQEMLEPILDVLQTAIEKNFKIYVAGNGGSAAIADHLTCDWTKGTHVQDKPALKVFSLASNSALLTAAANDFGYDFSFSKQIEMYGQKGDVLVLISSSGNSPNILEAAKMAIQKEMTILGFSGFSGGKLKEFAHYNLHIPIKNYGIVEDAHQMLMHVLAQFLAKKRDSHT